MNAFTNVPQSDQTTATRPSGRVGPNAITRMSEALLSLEGEGVRVQVFEAAGLARHLAHPPTEMVDETDVSALHRALVISLGPERADPASLEAGRLTGDYLLANRIPQKAQSLLRVLPRWLAARVLLTAVAKHAWTFAGSGRFSYTFSPRPVLRIEGSPICRQLRTADPACAYFAATFERLFRRILGDDVRVTETECESSGAAACVFRVEW